MVPWENAFLYNANVPKHENSRLEKSSFFMSFVPTLYHNILASFQSSSRSHRKAQPSHLSHSIQSCTVINPLIMMNNTYYI